MYDDEANPATRTAPAPIVGSRLALTALVLPVLSGTALFYVTSLHVALSIAVATVVGSSVLLAIDADGLGRTDLRGRRRASGQSLCLLICVLWIVFFPLAYVRRRHFAGPNLVLPSVVVCLYFVGGPCLGALIASYKPPACDSPEVVAMVEQVVRNSLVEAKLRSIDGHREFAYDRDANTRQGKCIAHTDRGNIAVAYTVRWVDRDRGYFDVRVPQSEAPACTHPEVVQVLERLIRQTPEGATARLIDGHREVSYDSAADRRLGLCVVHTGDAEIVVNYDVQWHDRATGQFKVAINGIEKANDRHFGVDLQHTCPWVLGCRANDGFNDLRLEVVEAIAVDETMVSRIASSADCPLCGAPV